MTDAISSKRGNHSRRDRGKGNRMDNLINRQAVLNTAEWVCKACEGNFLYYHDLLVAAIMDMAPEQRWIPCSERLPDGICQVIVQTNGGAIHDMFYEGKNVFGCEVWRMVDGGIYWDDEVIAWMPLPEPDKRDADG